jgi:16S rRNA (adenine(1408)-N(1))-methyltransferase
LQDLVSPFDRVVIDMGTGDGLFVYRSARANPRTFFIGIDANRRPLEKISGKIYRKPARGGLPNALFVQAAVEDLPCELEGVASEVQVNFPWGSLLKIVAGCDVNALRQIRRVCSAQAALKVVLGVDPVRDAAEIARLLLPELTLDYVDSTLASNYRLAGFEIVERRIPGPADRLQLETSWGRRLRGKSNRKGLYLVARPSNSLEWGVRSAGG